MEHLIINATINYIWYPLAWLCSLFSGPVVPEQLVYRCTTDICGTTAQLVITNGTCTMQSGLQADENQITGPCSLTEDQLAIHGQSGTIHSWQYRDGEGYIELYDPQKQAWIRLQRQ